jgi:Spy/CpxP family protein refolding chaperone
MLAALMLVATPVMAQQGGAPPQGGAPQGGQGLMDPAEMRRRQNEILFKDITLTEDQKKKIDSIQTTNADAQRQLMASGNMQDPETRQKMMDLRQRTMTDVRAVLCADQHAAFDKNLETLRSQGMGRGQRPPTA